MGRLTTSKNLFYAIFECVQVYLEHCYYLSFMKQFC